MPVPRLNKPPPDEVAGCEVVCAAELVPSPKPEKRLPVGLGVAPNDMV